ncbi:MAG: PstS family phosphate ABC transporter substrate-binding protein [Deltaproteobacteria bacterium]|nr:PstS family phosphate ABC transporter substrate-binding protein [Deltaproteobacteria bacterium]
MFRKFLLAGLAAMVAVVGLQGMAAASDQITITGSTTVLPIAQKAAEDFMKKNPEVRISVAGTGSGDGVKAIIEGTADIGDSSRDMKEKEIKLAESKGAKIAKHVVALDCIVPVVHPTNSISGLTIEQLKEIYTGKIENWKDVGGPDEPIVVVSRDSSSGTFEVWNEKVLDKARVARSAQMQASNGAVAQAVAGNKFAIGYVGIGYLNDQLKPLTVNGVTASPATAKDKTYAVARELFMFTAETPAPKVQAFLDFVLSAEGQKIVKEEGFVPMN